MLTPTRKDRARFREMCKVEPRLRTMLREIKRVDGSAPHFCANRVWYQRFKPTLCRLVGWEAEKVGLRTIEAYDVAYTVLYDALPPCQDCNCM